MSGFRLCARHGDYFASFPSCPFCEQEKAAAPVRKQTPPPAPAQAKIPVTPTPAARPAITLARPNRIVPKRRIPKPVLALFWIVGIIATITLGWLFPFSAIIILTIVAVLLLR